MSYSLNVIVCYLIFGSVDVPNTDSLELPAIFAFGVHAKIILESEHTEREIRFELSSDAIK